LLDEAKCWKIIGGEIMASKILVADDSITIQKVISITLANESVELVEAKSEDELFEKIANEKFSLVLLDFNLSESKSGYELAKHIKSSSPETRILAMLGTFDTAENDKVEEAGIDELVVKPFESSKFISKCRELASMSPVGDDFSPEQDTNLEEINVDSSGDSSLGEADGWVTNSPDIEDLSDESNVNLDEAINEEILPSSEGGNPLMQELEGWGMQVPGVIGEYELSEESLLPPIIGAEHEMSINESVPYNEVESRLNLDGSAEPSTSDLEYPDVQFTVSNGLEEGAALVGEHIVPEDHTPKLQSLSDLNISEEDIEDEEEVTEPTNKSYTPMFQSLDDLKEEEPEIEELDKTSEYEVQQFDLEKEIEEEQNPENFWAVDEDESRVANIEFQASESVPQASTSSNGLSEQDKTEIINALKNSIKPMVEEVIRDLYQEKIEKIAWEVIPDLAENLIKKEIKELSESVQ
jgi:CheY-like chemotaxis protein